MIFEMRVGLVRVMGRFKGSVCLSGENIHFVQYKNLYLRLWGVPTKIANQTV